MNGQVLNIKQVADAGIRISDGRGVYVPSFDFVLAPIRQCVGGGGEGTKMVVSHRLTSFWLAELAG